MFRSTLHEKTIYAKPYLEVIPLQPNDHVAITVDGSKETESWAKRRDLETEQGESSSEPWGNLWRMVVIFLMIFGGKGFSYAQNTYTYKIMDSSGTLVAQADASGSEGDTPAIPADVFSPWVTAYTYYATLADAESGANAISTLPSGTEVYVRYTFNAADFDGTTPYIMSSDRDRYFALRQNRLNNSNNTIPEESNLPTSSIKEESHYWFTIEGDPYQAVFRNVWRISEGDNMALAASMTGRGDWNCTSQTDIDNASKGLCDKYMILSHESSPSSSDINISLRQNTGDASVVRFVYRDNDGSHRVNTGYTRTGDRTKHRLTKTTLLPITFHVIDANGTEIYSTTYSEVPGFPASLPARAKRYMCQYGSLYDNSSLTGSPVTTFQEGMTDLWIQWTGMETDYPIQFSTVGDEHWYAIEMTNNLLIVQSPGTGSQVNGLSLSGTSEENQETVATKIRDTGDADAYLWAFYGDPYNMRIVNKKDAASGGLAGATSNIHQRQTNNRIKYSTVDSDLSLWGLRPINNLTSDKTSRYGTNIFSVASKANPDLYWYIWSNQLTLDFLTDWDGSKYNDITVYPYDFVELEYVTFHVCDANGEELVSTTYVPNDTPETADTPYPSTFVAGQEILSSMLPDHLKRSFCDYDLMGSSPFTSSSVPVDHVDVSEGTSAASPFHVYFRYTVSDDCPVTFYEDAEDVEQWYFIQMNQDYAWGQEYGSRYFVKHLDDADGFSYLRNGSDDQDLGYLREENDYTWKAEHYEWNGQWGEDLWLFAFIGDPYRVKVLSKSGEQFVAATDHVTSGTDNQVVTSSTDAENVWSMHTLKVPNDRMEGSFALGLNNEDNEPYNLFWTMFEFTGLYVEADRDNANGYQMMKVFPYAANIYEPVQFVVRNQLHEEGSGIDYTYENEDRLYSVGDTIGLNRTIRDKTAAGRPSIPNQVMRRLCTYTVYEDEWITVGDYTVNDGDNTVYIEYTADPRMFLSDGVMPTDSNVWFMDNGTTKDSYDIFSNHSYSETIKIDTDIKNDVNEQEQKGEFVKADIFSFSTTGNRFNVSEPSRLKFYFRGDPYHAQVMAYQPYLQTGQEYNMAPMNSVEPLNIRRYRYNVEFDNVSNPDNVFYWEVVEPRMSVADDDLCFALRFKEENAVEYMFEGDRVSLRENGVYYYLSNSYWANVYSTNSCLRFDLDNYMETFSNTVTGKTVDIHRQNTAYCVFSLIKPAVVYADVYKDAVSASNQVTHAELSEYYGVGEKFAGLPANLKRQFADYQWVESGVPTSDPYTVVEGENHITAVYEVTADNPFTEDPDEVKWWNVGVSGNYFMNFDRNYNGMNENGLPNSSVINGKNGDITLETDAVKLWKYKKGLQWAFYGDPYSFYAVNRRERSVDASGNAQEGYLYTSDNGESNSTAVVSDEQVYWTFMKNAQNDTYFLSWSEPRLTAATSSTANKDLGRNADFFTVPGDNYSTGSSVKLVSINQYESDGVTPGANNDVFDCILNVYNGENAIVATTGKTELARAAVLDAMMPIEVRRYDCDYTLWADETMTLHQLTCFDEKVAQSDKNDWDGTGDGSRQVFLLSDGCTIYATYTYDDTHYSTENERRWVNVYFDWDQEKGHYEWRQRTEIVKKTMQLEGETEPKEHEVEVTEDYLEWVVDQVVADKQGWINTLDDGSVENRTYGDISDRDAAVLDDTKNRGMKWLLVGDPYNFMLKSFNHRSDDDYYYVYHDGTLGSSHPLAHTEQGDISNIPADDSSEDTFVPQTRLTPAQKQGFTWTYKMQYKMGSDGNYVLDGNGKPVQLGYLASRDENVSGRENFLVGSVLSYATFDRELVNTTLLTQYRIDPETGLPYSSPDSVRQDRYGIEVKYQQVTYTDVISRDQQFLYTVGGPTTNVNVLDVANAKPFVIDDIYQYASMATFHLVMRDNQGHYNGENDDVKIADYERTHEVTYPTTMRDLSVEAYRFPDHSIRHYGVNNSIVLPWTWKRQFCDYQYILTEVAEPLADGMGLLIRDENGYAQKGSVIAGHPSLGQAFEEIPEELADYFLTFDVYYNTTFVPSTEASPWWYNISTVSNESMESVQMHYRHTDDVNTGKNRDTHFTDDYLWAIEGDPYGCLIHNRYVDWDNTLTVLDVTLSDDPDNPKAITRAAATNRAILTDDHSTEAAGGYESMSTAARNSLFELMTGNYAKAFLMHPVEAQLETVETTYIQSNFLFNGGSWPTQLNEMMDRYVKRNVSANWQLDQLNASQLLPYFAHAGYVGGLKNEVAHTQENQALYTRLQGTGENAPSVEDLQTAQRLVHDADNIVQLESGYYRIQAMPADALASYESGKTNVSGNRYVTGYLHESELTGDNPLNFWALSESEQDGFSRADIPSGEVSESYNNESLAAEYDPSSVFFFDKKDGEGDEATWNISTQGLFVNSFMMNDTEPSSANRIRIDDIGAACFTLRRGADATGNYLTCDPTNMRFSAKMGNANELEEKSGVQATKWLIQKVGTGTNEMPLKMRINNGKDEYYYASLYLSYDVLLPEGSVAYIGTGTPTPVEGEIRKWDMQLTNVGAYNTNPDYLTEELKDRFVPANTPVIVRSQATEPLVLTLPTATPSDALDDNILQGTFLSREASSDEQTDMSADGEIIYVFGMAADQVGFYKNANKNPAKGGVKDDKYLPHNKVYYVGPEWVANESSVKGITFNFFFTNESYVNVSKENYSINDVIELINSIIGDGHYVKARDFDSDSKTTVNDVILLINKITNVQ